MDRPILVVQLFDNGGNSPYSLLCFMGCPEYVRGGRFYSFTCMGGYSHPYYSYFDGFVHNAMGTCLIIFL